MLHAIKGISNGLNLVQLLLSSILFSFFNFFDILGPVFDFCFDVIKVFVALFVEHVHIKYVQNNFLLFSLFDHLADFFDVLLVISWLVDVLLV